MIDAVVGATTLTTTSDAQGQYQLDDVPAGRAELTYRLLNFSVVRRTVDVEDDASVAADVVLTLAVNADIVVTGQQTFRNIADIEDPAANLLGIAASASQGAITAAQLDSRPIMRPGEILETVPGLIVSQHSGEGKANQYYVRGFNLDHGTDFSTTVAGVPVNTPTGAHAHGYTDTSFLIPELVSGVQFKKGPYFADEGDFSAAGAANINYLSRLDHASMSASTGQEGWKRLFAAASPRLGAGYLLGAVEAGGYDGPWVQPDDYRKLNTVVRYSQGDSRNSVSVTGMGYWADWRATDQVPERVIASGVISRFGYLDGSDGGHANRQSVSAEFERSSGSSSVRGGGFVLHNRLDLFSNFTYFLDDPIRGDQFEQAEERVTIGGRVTYRRLGHVFDRHTESAAGIQVRRDWLDPVGLYRTEARRRLSTTREDQVGQTVGGLYAQTEIEWARRVRTTVGLRADVYQFAVTSDHAANSGAGASGLISPKFGAAFGPWAGTEIYVNAGMGYHSNDARGAVTRVDPVTEAPAAPVTPLVRARGGELGLRTVHVRGLQSTATLWYLDLDSELLFVGDAGTTEAGRPSRRAGLEWTNYARPMRWLTVDADLALSRARFRDEAPAGHYIPGALDRVVSAGLTVDPHQTVSGGIRVRHFGPRPLVEDASVESRATTLWNGDLGYRISSRARLALEFFNIFNADASDIDYFYASRLPGEPDTGVDDLHTHPALPRSLRVGLEWFF
jgi:TonB dependent receptor-like, beta-barrel/TonB-dependent Receptor Plug Domain